MRKHQEPHVGGFQIRKPPTVFTVTHQGSLEASENLNGCICSGWAWLGHRNQAGGLECTISGCQG